MNLSQAYLGGFMAVAPLTPATAEDVVMLPSGLETRLQEMLWDRPGGGLVYRFRFVAEDFVPDVADFDLLQQDLAFLCNEFALPKVSNVGPVPGQIIISLADRDSEFGVFDPEVSQVFEAYSVDDGTCVWEVF